MAGPVSNLPADCGSGLVQRILFSLRAVVAEGVLSFMYAFHRFGVTNNNYKQLPQSYYQTFMSRATYWGHVWEQPGCSGESAACTPR